MEIEYNGISYPVKEILIYKGTENEKLVTVSTLLLNQGLWNGRGDYVSKEAQIIDEQIFFCLEEEIFNDTYITIVDHLEGELAKQKIYKNLYEN